MRSSVQLLVLLREPGLNLYNAIVLKYLKFRNLTFTKLKVLFYLRTCLILFKKAVTCRILQQAWYLQIFVSPIYIISIK